MSRAICAARSVLSSVRVNFTRAIFPAQAEHALLAFVQDFDLNLFARDFQLLQTFLDCLFRGLAFKNDLFHGRASLFRPAGLPGRSGAGRFWGGLASGVVFLVKMVEKRLLKRSQHRLHNPVEHQAGGHTPKDEYENDGHHVHDPGLLGIDDLLARGEILIDAVDHWQQV
jgi:hypothetical protein